MSKVLTIGPKKQVSKNLIAWDPMFPPTRPLDFSALRFPKALRVLVLAPHPDDFDAIGVSMRFLHRQGHEIHVAVLTSGASGVEDGYRGARTDAQKAALREAEQEESCAFFGLAAGRLSFLRLWEGGTEETERERLRSYLLLKQPELVFLPHGKDSNRTHQRTYENFRSIALEEKLQLWACMNLDAKTLHMRSDLFMYFGEPDALWKAQLLHFHRSQQERNLNTRNAGFDERVLDVNKNAANRVGAPQLYAEVFELEQYGAKAG